MEVRAKTSSKSPKPLSVFWGHHKSPAQWVYPARASQSPDLPPACFVPFIVVVQTHAPPPREPLWRSARGRPPRSGRDRRRETRGRPRGRTYDVPVPAKRAAPLPASSLTPNPSQATKLKGQLMFEEGESERKACIDGSSAQQGGNKKGFGNRRRTCYGLYCCW